MKVSDAKPGVTRQVPSSEASSEAAKLEAGKAVDTAKATEASARAVVADKVTVAQPSVVDEARKAASTERATRIKELEAAVRQGTYKPDAGRIAERILEEAEITARMRASLL
jgi:negative regulator of flagellin synthesis FlgM